MLHWLEKIQGQKMVEKIDILMERIIDWELTFWRYFLQRVATGLHATHTQDGFIDPPHMGSNISVDVQNILQQATKWKSK